MVKKVFTKLSNMRSEYNRIWVRLFPLLGCIANEVLHTTEETSHNLLTKSISEILCSQSYNKVIKAAQQPIKIPGKTCFEHIQKIVYLRTAIEKNISMHFTRTLQKIGYQLAQEVPTELTRNPQTSWIQYCLNGIRRAVEPLCIPYYIATQARQYNPYSKELQQTYRLLTTNQNNYRGIENNCQSMLDTMISSAEILYKAQKNRLKIQDEQSRIIAEQAEMIKHLQAELSQSKQDSYKPH
jgi:hypothetical protein